MKEYLVIEKTSASKFQASLNDLHGDGYELVDFVVVSDDGEPIGWFGVMKLIKPTANPYRPVGSTLIFEKV